MAKELNNKVANKLILQATIVNKSPLLIATGKAEQTDFEVILDSDKKPFIPASGFAGMLRASCENIKNRQDLQKQFDYIWGSNADKKDDTSQSHIIIDDLKLKGVSFISVRDGVKISNETGTAETGNKYDYEIVEPEARFLLNAEITIREDYKDYKNIFLQLIRFMIEQGQLQKNQQGAFKTSGFGILEWTDPKIYGFNFPADADAWFAYLGKDENPGKWNSFSDSKNYPIEEIEELKFESDILTITGEFSIKNSLIISDTSGTGGGVGKAPDKTHLKSMNGAGESLLTGKSLKGPIRHRALKILNTIRKDRAVKPNENEFSFNEKFINNLFGFVDENNKTAQKSRIKSFEIKVKGADSLQIQPRIKIDRFTGGAIEHLMMQTQPLWHKTEKIDLKFEIEKCTKEEAGLMLLVMKDLVTEDLPIGGEKAIGRGILKGHKLSVIGKIIENEIKEEVNLLFNETGILSPDSTKIEMLNGWITKIQK